MPTVTFVCECPQAIVDVHLQKQGSAHIDHFVFNPPGGTKKQDCESGLHFVDVRAKGTPGTKVSLKVTDGGTMAPVDKVLNHDGELGENRDLVVP